jgi:Alcohol dehydrogenase GroES-like domain
MRGLQVLSGQAGGRGRSGREHSLSAFARVNEFIQVGINETVYIQEHGPIDELKVAGVRNPTLTPGELLVQIEAAGIKPSDLVSVQGRLSGALLPRAVARDFAGIIVEGPEDLIGRKAWASGGGLGAARDGK